MNKVSSRLLQLECERIILCLLYVNVKKCTKLVTEGNVTKELVNKSERNAIQKKTNTHSLENTTKPRLRVFELDPHLHLLLRQF